MSSVDVAVTGGALGTLAGVADIAADQASSPHDNWAEVQTGTITAMVVGGISAVRGGGGFTMISGALAGGAASGLLGAASQPLAVGQPIAGAVGGFIGGLGASGQSLADISRNMVTGFRSGALAGLAGMAVEMGGNYLTEIVCN